MQVRQVDNHNVNEVKVKVLWKQSTPPSLPPPPPKKKKNRKLLTVQGELWEGFLEEVTLEMEVEGLENVNTLRP